MARRPASRFPFTIERLRALKPPAKGRVYHYDTKTTGLCLCASSSGRKTFYWYRWANGKPTRICIGPFPGVPLETARMAAEKLVGDVACGKDPLEERQQNRQAPMVDVVFAGYLEHHSKPRKRTWPGGR